MVVVLLLLSMSFTCYGQVTAGKEVAAIYIVTLKQPPSSVSQFRSMVPEQIGNDSLYVPSRSASSRLDIIHRKPRYGAHQILQYLLSLVVTPC